MRTRPALALFVGGAAAIAALVFAGDRLAFEAQALLLRSSPFNGNIPQPDVVIQCEPDCKAGWLLYEVIVDATGRPRALRYDGALRSDGASHFLKSSARARAARAALAARWPAPESGRPFRAYQGVGVFPPQRLPTRHVPFPDTHGQTVSITLERAGIPSPYPSYVVTLGNDGAVDFCQPDYIRTSGPHRSRISHEAFAALVQEFRDADFFSLDDRYVTHATDGPAYYLRVRIGDWEKTVVDYYGNQVGMPQVITTLQTAVDEAVESSRLTNPPQDASARADCPTPLSETIG